MKIKINVQTNGKITEKKILEFNIILLGIVGGLQSSLLFSYADLLNDILKVLIFLLAMLMLVFKIEKNISVNIVIKVMLVVLPIIYTCIKTANYSFLLICIFLISTEKTTITRFIEISLNCLIVFGSVHIILWFINCFLNLGYPVFSNEVEHRISFLLIHPNIAALRFGWGIIMYIWLVWDRLDVKKMVTCFLIASILYITTKSDSCLIIIFFLILVTCRKSLKMKRLLIFVSKFCFPIFGILNVLIAKMYLIEGSFHDFIYMIDIIFSRRIAMANLAISQNGISVLGKIIETQHSWDEIFNFGNYTIDSVYIYLYICIGVIYFLLISIGFYMLAKYKNYKVSLIVISFSLYALIEVHCIYLTNCFALLLLKCIIFKEKKLV